MVKKMEKKMTNHNPMFYGIQLIIYLYLVVFGLHTGHCSSLIDSYQLDITSSFNPVGSGARALGMGGAFIAVADDATSASWNPGGLVQLRKPEIAFVYEWVKRNDDNSFNDFQPFSGKQSVTNPDINYLSISFPFSLFNRNMVISYNYHKLYDLNKEWSLRSRLLENNYTQKGKLAAYGIAYGVRLMKDLSFGITINFWDNFFDQNGWTETQIDTIQIIESQTIRQSDYSLKGINANLGLIWRINEAVTFGAVLKLPFNAKLDRNILYQKYNYNLLTERYDLNSEESLEFPSSYGIGLGYRVTESFTISGDIYRTNWQHFIHNQIKGPISPISGQSVGVSQIHPTTQVRLGMEYLFVNSAKKYEIPLRSGIFYDPAPAKNTTDDFWGISFGIGLATVKHCIDFAYQFRWGNNVRAYLAKNFDFSQDVQEHTIYSSYVYHF